MKIILASSSPRRKELLERLGLKFTVVESNVKEKYLGRPVDVARENAYGKAFKVAQKVEKGIVIGVDTIVVLNDEIIGKPESLEEAKKILLKLNGKEHKVISAVAVIDVESGRKVVEVEETKVKFRELSIEEINLYVSTGEPLGKAGAYAIQGMGALLVERIDGCYYNVVGLPLTKLYLVLKTFFKIDLLKLAASKFKN